MRLPAIVLNMLASMPRTNLASCHSFIRTTDSQVLRDLRQAIALGDVHEIEDVLLEARAAEADAGLQELRSNPRVGADRMSHLVDVGLCLLA